jgi:hypothetical protein
MQRERHLFDYILIGSFIFSLFTPLILTNNRTQSTIEQRNLAAFPNWNKTNLMNFTTQFQTWFNDHFGFRNHLAQMYYLFGVWLETSLSPRVIIGKEQWLFYIDPKDGNSLEDYRKNDNLTPKQLQQWKSVLEERYQWLKHQGIDYVFVIAPDKHSIYPEYFPDRIKVIGTQTRLDQLMVYMKTSQVPILDLRQALIKAKAEGDVFYKNDTHWNDFGAAVAQYEIISYLAKLYPNIQPIKYRKQDFFWNHKGWVGTAKMLNLSDYLQNYINPKLKQPILECSKKLIGKKTKDLIKQTFLTNCRNSAPTALIFRDSFFESLQPYISQHLSTTVFVWERPNNKKIAQFIKQYAPKIMIEERVERALKQIPALSSSTPKTK